MFVFEIINFEIRMFDDGDGKLGVVDVSTEVEDGFQNNLLANVGLLFGQIQPEFEIFGLRRFLRIENDSLCVCGLPVGCHSESWNREAAFPSGPEFVVEDIAELNVFGTTSINDADGA